MNDECTLEWVNRLHFQPYMCPLESLWGAPVCMSVPVSFHADFLMNVHGGEEGPESAAAILSHHILAEYL